MHATLAGAIKAGELKPADNCVLVESAPHSEVMREAAFVVTHGSHGTVMRALVSRAAMLVIPHGRDQNDNAARVTDRRAGLSLMPDAPVEAIREACERLLNESSFRSAAKKLGDQVAAEAENSTVVQEVGSRRVAGVLGGYLSLSRERSQKNIYEANPNSARWWQEDKRSRHSDGHSHPWSRHGWCRQRG